MLNQLASALKQIRRVVGNLTTAIKVKFLPAIHQFLAARFHRLAPFARRSVEQLARILPGLGSMTAARIAAPVAAPAINHAKAALPVIINFAIA